MYLSKVIITLTSKAYQNKTLVLNDCQFVDGKFEYVGPAEECNGYARYFQATQSCECWMGMPGTEPISAPVHEPVKEVTPKPETDPERETKIMEAILAVVQENWIQDDVVPHPPVTLIAELMDDASVTKEEIISVVEMLSPADNEEE